MKLSHLIIAAITISIAHPAATHYFQQQKQTPQEKCMEAQHEWSHKELNPQQIAKAYQLCTG